MSFSESSLVKKFSELNQTQQSVQTLSLWLIHHRKNAKLIVSLWLKELKKEPSNVRKLAFIYLANDILQTGRKKGPEYSGEFASVLEDAFRDIKQKADDKMRSSLERILNIWKERRVFASEIIDLYKGILIKSKISEDDDTLHSPTESKSNSFVEITKKKVSLSDTSDGESQSKKSKITSETPFQITQSIKEEVLKKLNEIKAPESGEMIKLLQDLEKSASSDALIREKIAQLPPQISDLNVLKTLNDTKDVQELLTKVNDALNLLNSYNARLQDELVTRKQTSTLLAAFIKQHKTEHNADNANIQEWKSKFEQVMNVKKDLETHYKSLPDLSVIEESFLNPLPSAGDLFS